MNFDQPFSLQSYFFSHLTVSFERISIQSSPADLKKRGITYLFGSRLAEFGYAYMQGTGYPNGDAYLFVGRVP